MSSIIACVQAAMTLRKDDVDAKQIMKVEEGCPHSIDMIVDGEGDLVINTTFNTESLADSYTIRREALMRKVTYFTHIAAARATDEAHNSHGSMPVRELQNLHKTISC